MLMTLYSNSFTEPLVRKTLWKRSPETQILPNECDPFSYYRELYDQGLSEEYFKTVPKF